MEYSKSAKIWTIRDAGRYDVFIDSAYPIVDVRTCMVTLRSMVV
jgi:hypothetical protein